MATTATVAPHGPDESNDPYFYGYRLRERVTPTGAVVWDRIPLTEYDVLHPQEDDHVSQNTVHAQHSRYLAEVCVLCLAGDPTAVILNDTLIAWDVAGLEPHSPDVAIIKGVRARRPWGTFNVAEEGVRPELIIEVTSPSTVKTDLTDKVKEYAQARVGQYVIVDGVDRGEVAPVRLVDYRLVGDQYEAQPLNERGWVWLAAVGVWLGVVEGEPVCFDEDGQVIGNFAAQATRAAAEAARAEREAARAEREEAARVEAEARLGSEVAARAEAEARLRALEEELQRLRGQ